MKLINNKNLGVIRTPEAFYYLFRSLPQNERFVAARYILHDEEIRYYLEIPNQTTLEAFSEDRKTMPVFNTIDQLREDLKALPIVKTKSE